MEEAAQLWSCVEHRDPRRRLTSSSSQIARALCESYPRQAQQERQPRIMVIHKKVRLISPMLGMDSILLRESFRIPTTTIIDIIVYFRTRNSGILSYQWSEKDLADKIGVGWDENLETRFAEVSCTNV
ncbi:hypothetical protein PRIPAC_89136 [Pristionchus pacificus]|uniref:Uncharacterized protein n=1 Tax=Pristionchus pacificus TaxID=54126 RepID=A0A2A6CX24_PRIPA|nr:hypothetical protein PRIPAC_89136 [Pristionchus pacificus]|eukprot:PDM82784.1 hypothetical protein PRIPAC_37177 [Pristionchus pacificus]